MRLPEFTAEASLGKTSEHYSLSTDLVSESGRVQPQGLFVNPNGDLVYCDSTVGCFVVRRKRIYNLF